MRRDGWLVSAGAAVALAVLVTPLLTLLAQTPWSRLPALLAEPDVVSAVVVSLTTSLTATALVVVLGTPLALRLAHARGLGARVVRVLVTLPLVLPPVAAGMALLATLGRSGLLGRLTGLGLPFTPGAVIASQVLVALPFYVITLEGGLRRDLRELEEAAATCGATRWQVLRHVTLPLVAPSLLAGTVLAWARALGEFGATITFAGNLPGVTQTLPLALYLAAQHDTALASALATVMLALSASMLLVAQSRVLAEEHA